jgi:hypothetical protein
MVPYLILALLSVGQARHQEERGKSFLGQAPPTMNIGRKVEVRFSKSKRLSGTIARINNDETCDVDLDSGGNEKEIPLVLIRDVAVDSGKEDEETGIKSNFLRIGDRVEAKFRGRGSRYYRGTIKNISAGGTYDIVYDDGDLDIKLSAEHIRKLPLGNEIDDNDEEQTGRVSRLKSIGRSSADVEKKPATARDATTDDSVPHRWSSYSKGQRVMARYRGRGKRWYKGTIAECNGLNDEYSIHYDDGDWDTNLSAEFIRADVPEVLQENTREAARVRTGRQEVALMNSENSVGSKENGNPATIDGKVVGVNTTTDDAAPAPRFHVATPDDVSVIVADAADGDVSLVADSSHRARNESPIKGDHAEKQKGGQSTADYWSGKGNRVYRGKVVNVKTIHLYEIEYPDSTTDTNIPFGALRLPQGFNHSDIKVGTTVDVLSWQDRFAAFL